jgi:hypothetical protein
MVTPTSRSISQYGMPFASAPTIAATISAPGSMPSWAAILR